MASAHSPWPRCRILMRSRSLQICTRSPTANCCWKSTSEPAAGGLATLVSTVGLKVQLNEYSRRKSIVEALTGLPPGSKRLNRFFLTRISYRLPLGYETTMSWSSSIPTTVPVVPRHSNIPSVQPPWPCCSVCTISSSRSTLTWKGIRSNRSFRGFFSIMLSFKSWAPGRRRRIRGRPHVPGLVRPAAANGLGTRCRPWRRWPLSDRPAESVGNETKRNFSGTR